MLPAAVVLSEQERAVLRVLDSPWGDIGDLEQDVLERLSGLPGTHDRYELTQAVRHVLQG